MADESNDRKPLEPPQESWKDQAQQLLVIGTDAATGTPLGSLVSMLIGSPLNRRRLEFDRDVSAKLEELIQQGRVDREVLGKHEQFISTYVEATLAAVRTHEQEKRESLRNAILNSALDTLDQSKQQAFVSLIAEFTPWHLRFLRFFQDPKGAFVTAGKTRPAIAHIGNLPNELQKLYPALRTEEEFVELILNELNAKKLTEVPRYRLTGGDETVFCKRTTSLGDEFIRYITEPS